MFSDGFEFWLVLERLRLSLLIVVRRRVRIQAHRADHVKLVFGPRRDKHGWRSGSVEARVGRKGPRLRVAEHLLQVLLNKLWVRGQVAIYLRIVDLA